MKTRSHSLLCIKYMIRYGQDCMYTVYSRCMLQVRLWNTRYVLHSTSVLHLNVQLLVFDFNALLYGQQRGRSSVVGGLDCPSHLAAWRNGHAARRSSSAQELYTVGGRADNERPSTSLRRSVIVVVTWIDDRWFQDRRCCQILRMICIILKLKIKQVVQGISNLVPRPTAWCCHLANLMAWCPSLLKVS